MRIRMREQQNWLLGMIDSSIRQAWLIISNQSDAILARNVFCRDDYKFAPVELSVEPDVLDHTSRNLAANGRSVEHSRQVHIIDVARGSGYFVATFFAWHRLPDDVLCRHMKSPI